MFPLDIEECLSQHENVRDVIEFGVDLSDVEQAVCAWITLKNPKHGTTYEEMNEFMKDKLAFYKIPKFIKFVDELPMNKIGKYR